MLNHIDEVLITKEQIQEKVAELGKIISRDNQSRNLHLVAILKGALIFLADLARYIKVQCTIDFMVVSSYFESQSSGEVRIIKDLDMSIRGKDILIVEDIIDNGRTLYSILKTLSLRQPASLKVCTLLDKPYRRTVPIVPDYNGFTIPDKFVVGYGLDYLQRYRNLPFIATLKEEFMNLTASKL